MGGGVSAGPTPFWFERAAFRLAFFFDPDDLDPPRPEGFGARTGPARATGGLTGSGHAAATRTPVTPTTLSIHHGQRLRFHWATTVTATAMAMAMAKRHRLPRAATTRPTASAGHM